MALAVSGLNDVGYKNIFRRHGLVYSFVIYGSY